MTHLLLARTALSGLCIVQGVATLAIDLNKTHATNPAWPGHARFHLVWQSITVAALSTVALVLIWSRTTSGDDHFYVACLLVSLSPAGFLAAWAARRLYKGTLSDRNGIPPLRVRLRGREFFVDMNLAAVLIAFLALAFAIALYRGYGE
jgi:hypothetical protein